MTWVIGMPTYFGYCAGFADIQVTFRDKSTKDCLRKLYPVGRCVALGFSGSVAIGFKMVETLTHYLSDIPPHMGWNPTEVVKWWQLDAQDVFRSFSDDEKRVGCNLMLFGVHPGKKENQLANIGELYRLHGPTFTPRRAKMFQILAIGSGNDVATYSKTLRQLSRYPDGIMQIEVGNPGGMASALSHHITKVLEQSPAKGISSHLHVCRVWSDRIEMGTNDRRYIGEPRESDFLMPRVVNSYAEFQKLAASQGVSAEGARC